MTSGTVPQVSVVVVTYNSETTIAECLASLRLEARRIPLEVLVVDNASGDGTVKRLRREFPEATVIQAARNLGFAAASNAGARGARGRHLVLLNPDTVVQPLGLVELVRGVESEREVGAVGPRVVRPDGGVELSWGSMVGLGSELVRKVVGELHAWRFWPVRRAVEWRSRRAMQPGWVSGACLLVPTALYHELGGLDEGYFLYLEDVDLCARIRAAGYRVLYWPRAEVTHVGGVSAASDRAATALAYRRSQLRFYRRHHGAGARAALRLYLRAKFLAAEGLAWAGRRSADARLARDLLDVVREDEALGDAEG